MTAYELARKLLEGPDLPVGFHDGDVYYGYCIEVMYVRLGPVVDMNREPGGDLVEIDGVQLIADEY